MVAKRPKAIGEGWELFEEIMVMQGWEHSPASVLTQRDFNANTFSCTNGCAKK